MSKAELTDAEVILRLRAVSEHGSIVDASLASGVCQTSLKDAVRIGKARGLSASSQIKDPLAEAKSKIKALENEVAAIHKHNDTAESIRRTIYGLAETTPEPPKWLTKKRPAGLPGVPMALWSDWHWGERVFSEQVGGVNEFDRSIAKARLRRLVDTTLDLTLHHMVNPTYPGIVICLGGDMISGNIHEELRETNDGTIQQTLIELQDQIAAALTTIADTGAFPKIYVPCVVGNHGRMKIKPHAKNRTFESFEWNLYQQLERHFINDKRFKFFIPGETDAHFTVLGHRFLLTHGDTLGVRGGDGIIGAIGPIARGSFKVGRSEAQIGRDFDTLLMGHWHTYIPRGEAAPVIVNGTLKGYDEYARLFLRVPYSRPSQALWFVHQKHGITAQWQIFLDDVKNYHGSKEFVTF